MSDDRLIILVFCLCLIIAWILSRLIREKKIGNQKQISGRLIYDGQCPFCRLSVEKLKRLDKREILDFVDLHNFKDIKQIHSDLPSELAMSQVHLIESDGKLYGGYRAFQRLCLMLPALYILIPVVYFPGMGVVGPFIYRIIARKRYSFHQKRCCQINDHK